MKGCGWIKLLLMPLWINFHQVYPDELRLDAIIESESDLRIIQAAKAFIYHGLNPQVPIEITAVNVSGENDNTNLLFTLKKVCARLEQGVHGMVAHVNCANSHLLASLLAPIGLPTLLVPSPTECIIDQKERLLGNQGSVLSMIPDLTQANEALFQILNVKTPVLFTRTTVIIYDQDTDPQYIANFFLFENRGGYATFCINNDDDSYLDYFERYSETGESHVFILFCNKWHIHSILIKAESLGLNGSFNVWIAVFTPMSKDIVRFASWTEGNFLTLQPRYLSLFERACPIDVSPLRDILPSDLHHGQAYLLDATILLADAMLIAGGNLTHPVSPRFTLNCSVPEGDVFHGGEYILHNINKEMSQGLNYHEEISKEGFVEPLTLDLMAVDPGDADGFSHRASWTPKEGLKLLAPHILVNPAHDFKNRTLIIGIVRAEPFVVFNDKDPKKPEGFCIDIINVLARFLNFTISYASWDAEDYGNLDERTNQWTGMIGRVIKGDVDMAVGAFTVTKDRGNVASFTVPYFEDRNGILVERPREDSKMERVFLPYHITTWIAISVSIGIFGTLLFCVRFCLSDNEESENEESDGSRTSPVTIHSVLALLRENLWFAYGTFLEQSMDNYPRSPSGRVLVVVWWLFTIVMSATYTANLVAYLTVTITVKPIDTLEQLAESPDVYPIIFPGHVLNDLFRNSAPSSTYGRIWSKLKQNKEPMPNETSEALKMVETGRYALLTDTGVIKRLAVTECQKFVTGKQEFNPAGLAFVLPKYSPRKKLIDQYLVQMQESGLIEKWHSYWWPDHGSNCTKEDTMTSTWSKLGLESLAGAFLVVVAAIGAALILLLFELLISRRQRKAQVSINSASKETESERSSDIALDRW